MASVYREFKVGAASEDVWDAVTDVGRAHERLFPGVLTDARLEGDGAGVRVVTFANGAVVRERVVAVDHDLRRLVYAVIDGPFEFEHHSASIRVHDTDDGGTRVEWVSDVLPDEAAARVGGLMDLGVAAVRRVHGEG